MKRGLHLFPAVGERSCANCLTSLMLANSPLLYCGNHREVVSRANCCSKHVPVKHYPQRKPVISTTALVTSGAKSHFETDLAKTDGAKPSCEVPLSRFEGSFCDD